MNKYVVLYHSPAEAMAQMENATPEEKAKGMEPWMKWMETYKDNIIDGGAPLIGGQGIKPKGNWAGSTKDVSGYSIVQAESLEEAKAMFKDHPHLAWHPDAAVEIHETVNLMP